MTDERITNHPPDFRLLRESEPHSGVWNMAVDETLLESALERGLCTLRLYRWREPTVSLGYFQKPEEAALDPRLRGLALVRRLSGGGAILHHHEWTYSLALPPAHPLTRRPLEVYATVHDILVQWMNSLGIPASMRRDAAGANVFPRETTDGARAKSGVDCRAAEPFLCFGRGDPHDIVVGGCKIVGSAQRRRRQAILQHGSLLLRASEFAPEFPGLEELTGMSELENAFPEAFARVGATLGAAQGISALDEAEFNLANHLATTRYSTISNLAD